MSKKSDILKWVVIVALLAVVIFLLAKESNSTTTTPESEAVKSEAVPEDTPAVTVDSDKTEDEAEAKTEVKEEEAKKLIPAPTPQRNLIAYVQNNYNTLINAAVAGDTKEVQRIDSGMADLITASEVTAKIANGTSTNSGMVVTIEGFLVDGEVALVNGKALLANYTKAVEAGEEIKLYPTGIVDSSTGTTLTVFATDPLTAYRMTCTFLNAQIEKALNQEQAKQESAQRLQEAQQAAADAQQAARDAQQAAERAEDSARDRRNDDYYDGWNTVVVQGWGSSLPSYRPKPPNKPNKPNVPKPPKPQRPPTIHRSSGGSHSILGHH